MKAVLYIEDNLEIRENLAEILELAGYTVYVAQDGRQGVAMAKEKLPSVILCDILMPEMNGYEVFETLKQTTETADIPFVFVTASVEKAQVQAGLKMGAAGYVSKPFEEDELLKAIENCLSGNSR